ncbi:MAG: dihydrolipoyllysine-residue succinyltransferase [Bdellovibrionaceae bacterium]|nr:dihydrolipoyllysine-residue succinyltransferase [Pseudobdellovibrionaceae bacterium]|tara:strand:+ start:446 stop:1708 length:1263 start_codon:yes stop_codon:yes gene_type:complete
MSFEIKVPAVGESITEATIGEWQKQNGEYVERDDVLLVLETDKASVEVVAETSGVLKTKAEPGDVVPIGSVVGEIDESAAKPAGSSTEKSSSAEESSKSSAESAPQGKASSSAADTLSPAVRKLVEENNLNPSDIKATGPKGNLTKEDVLNHLENGGAKASQGKAAAPAAASKPSKPAPEPVKMVGGSTETQREKMTTLRKRIAERLVEAQHTAAILTTFNEIDMSAVMSLRSKYKEDFKKKYDVNLGFMGFFVKAVIEALKAYPRVNAFIEGDEVVYHKYCNIGIAVGTEKGLMVPVLKNAEMMSIAEIEASIKAYAIKARDGKISIDDLSGGTFTISNGGVYGSLMSTPILNPPQSGILGMHKIEERPMAINGEVVIRPMMYVALSYDHRIIDGAESVSFLVKVKEALEDPARLVLEI